MALLGDATVLGPSLPSSPPPQRRLLLAGGGHSHALVLRLWAMRPHRRPVATAITLVSRSGSSLYSGMVPALVAGLYGRRQCSLDLRHLCAQAGVRFVQAEIEGLDPRDRRLRLVGRPALHYELLSLDVGALTGPAALDPDADGVAVKPLEPFLAWVEALEPGRRLRLRGGGAAAVELALALRRRGLRPELLLRGQALHLGSAAANGAGERLLQRAGIPVRRGVSPGEAADLRCTGSRAPAWLAAAGLPVEPASGRVLTGADLRVCGHGELFASGDCAVIAAAPRPPSGVWAVRAAPVLAENLRRALESPGGGLRIWRPQSRALQLLADGSVGLPPQRPGDGPRFEALALWGPIALGPSRLLGRWKDRIDRAFMQRLGSGDGAAPPPPPFPAAMACRGCAAKLAADPLAAALERLAAQGEVPPAEDAVALLHAADGTLHLQSLDGFPSLVEDPWLNARLTTLHACSDLWACGAGVASAQALVTVPVAAAPLQEELLFQSLSGVRSVLDPLGARLIGGHTLEGRDGAGLSLALTVQGPLVVERPWPKGPLRSGHALLLSRPLGSGVLLAAAMVGAADPADLDHLLAGLQQSQAPLVELLAAHGCSACTDITGFGLLGHLGEMVGARSGEGGGGGPRLWLEATAIPAWPGALDLLQRGFASSLAPANARALELLEGPLQLEEGAAAGTPLALARRHLLLDPQTCGPLLAAVPAPQAPAALAALRRSGFERAALIGRVLG